MIKNIKALVLLGMVSIMANGVSMASVKEAPSEMSNETKECVKCHMKDNPGIVQQWGRSKHYGANVGCYECHQADEGDVDAYTR
jgi:nitrate/TMAO reductase-like tetraheme cytochrome c subunit